MDDTFALWLTVIMLGVMIVGIIWMFTDRVVELRHRVNKLEIYRRLDEDEKFWEKTPKREWVGLEDENLDDVTDEFYKGAVWAEAKLKEKNT